MQEGHTIDAYLAILASAGIVPPPDRLAGVAAELADIRSHVGRVNEACADVEPATVFGTGR